MILHICLLFLFSCLFLEISTQTRDFRPDFYPKYLPISPLDLGTPEARAWYESEMAKKSSASSVNNVVEGAETADKEEVNLLQIAEEAAEGGGRDMPCGTRIMSRILHGQKVTDISEWPWAASVRIVCVKKGKTSVDVLQTCSGTIIHSNFILTAAHCTYISAAEVMECQGQEHLFVPDHHDMSKHKLRAPISQMLVSVGHHDWKKIESIVVKKIVTHTEYRSNGNTNDIALLELGKTIKFGKDVNKICLPKMFTPYNGAQGYILGFGHTKGSLDNPANGLHETTNLREELVQMFHDHPCEQAFICSIHKIRRTEICDSGGPLMRESGGSWYQVGITRGHQSDSLGLFTRLTPFCKWINESTNGAAHCTKPI